MKATVKTIVLGISLASFVCGTIAANGNKSGDPSKNKMEFTSSLKSTLPGASFSMQADAMAQTMSEKYDVKFDVNKTMSVFENNSKFEMTEQDALNAFEDQLARTTNVRFNVNQLISVNDEKGF